MISLKVRGFLLDRENMPIVVLADETGRLTLGAAGWTEPQIAQFRGMLQTSGWQVDANGTQLVMSRARPGTRS